MHTCGTNHAPPIKRHRYLTNNTVTFNLRPSDIIRAWQKQRTGSGFASAIAFKSDPAQMALLVWQGLRSMCYAIKTNPWRPSHQMEAILVGQVSCIVPYAYACYCQQTLAQLSGKGCWWPCGERWSQQAIRTTGLHRLCFSPFCLPYFGVGIGIDKNNDLWKRSINDIFLILKMSFKKSNCYGEWDV